MKKNIDIFYQLKTKLKEYRAECRIVSASHIQELESEYNLSHTRNLVDKQFLEKYIHNYIDFSVIKKYPAIRSLIIIATPSPQIDVNFNINDSVYWLKIPPTYSDRIKVTGNIKNITSQIFDSNGYHTFPVVLPKKLLAVHSGIAKYGKNNISYVPGMGSYNRLTIFATDLPCHYDSWQDLQVLERCNNCKACQNNCPTAAICADRFIIKAERCLTYMNEQLEPFPDWIDSRSHNSIIGCMRCQNICPENKKYNSVIKNKDEFSKTETSLILKGIPFEELPGKLQLKINNLCLKSYYKHLPRNLTALLV
jgi:epoxyqueuosine reductase